MDTADPGAPGALCSLRTIRMMKRVLNVGGNSKDIALPSQYRGWQQVLLDIDPASGADIVCDARSLGSLAPAQFDAVYCSHNLEHYHRHEVQQVLRGFVHLLAPAGLVQVRVPDVQAVMHDAVRRGLDLEDELYASPSGPVSVLDVLYGFGKEIERSGQPYFAHKTGFSPRSLMRALQRAGFVHVYSATAHLEVQCIGLLQPPDPATRRAFGLPPPARA